MFVQINKEEFLKEITKKAWYQTNNHYLVNNIPLSLFLALSISFMLTSLWLQFFIVRIIIVSGNLHVVYSFFQSKNYNYRILLHIAFFLLSVTSALLCALVNPQRSERLFSTLYSVVILFFNLQVFWEPINSVIQTLIAILLLAIFFNLFSRL